MRGEGGNGISIGYSYGWLLEVDNFGGRRYMYGVEEYLLNRKRSMRMHLLVQSTPYSLVLCSTVYSSPLKSMQIADVVSLPHY